MNRSHRGFLRGAPVKYGLSGTGHHWGDEANNAVGKSTSPCRKTKCACMLGVSSTFSKSSYFAS